jgi:hypothetical protein
MADSVCRISIPILLGWLPTLVGGRSTCNVIGGRLLIGLGGCGALMTGVLTSQAAPKTEARNTDLFSRMMDERTCIIQKAG